MSVPHTGRLKAIVDGTECLFDGDTWTSPDAALCAVLNEGTGRAVKHHHDIRELADQVLEAAGLLARSRILGWTGDAWPKSLPPGAVD